MCLFRTRVVVGLVVGISYVRFTSFHFPERPAAGECPGIAKTGLKLRTLIPLVMSYTNLYCESAVFLLEHPDALFEDIPFDLLSYWLEIDRAYKHSDGWENPLFHIFMLIGLCMRRSGSCPRKPSWFLRRFDDFRFFIGKEAQAREAGGHILPIHDLQEYSYYRSIISQHEQRRNAAEQDSAAE